MSSDGHSVRKEEGGVLSRDALDLTLRTPDLTVQAPTLPWHGLFMAYLTCTSLYRDLLPWICSGYASAVTNRNKAFHPENPPPQNRLYT